MEVNLAADELRAARERAARQLQTAAEKLQVQKELLMRYRNERDNWPADSQNYAAAQRRVEMFEKIVADLETKLLVATRDCDKVSCHTAASQDRLARIANNSGVAESEYSAAELTEQSWLTPTNAAIAVGLLLFIAAAAYYFLRKRTDANPSPIAPPLAPVYTSQQPTTFVS